MSCPYCGSNTTACCQKAIESFGRGASTRGFEFRDIPKCPNCEALRSELDKAREEAKGNAIAADGFANMLEQAEAKLKAVMPVVEAATEYNRAFYSGNGKRQSNARMSLLEAVDNYFAEHINAFTKGESDE